MVLNFGFGNISATTKINEIRYHFRFAFRSKDQKFHLIDWNPTKAWGILTQKKWNLFGFVCTTQMAEIFWPKGIYFCIDWNDWNFDEISLKVRTNSTPHLCICYVCGFSVFFSVTSDFRPGMGSTARIVNSYVNFDECWFHLVVLRNIMKPVTWKSTKISFVGWQVGNPSAAWSSSEKLALN